MASSWPPKDPDEILDYDINWTKRLYSKAELAAFQALVDAGSTEDAALAAVVPADTILTSAFTLPTGIVANSTSNTTTATKVWIAGGTEPLTYAVQNRVVTAGGRTMDKTVDLKIKSK